MNQAHSEEYKNCTVKIVYDPDPESPRECYNLGKMACWHQRYKLGDVQPDEDDSAYLLELARRAVHSNYPEALLKANMEKIVRRHYVLLPLYLYDHSGITISCAAFSGPWDSGQVGIIHCDLKTAVKEQMLPEGSTWETLTKWRLQDGTEENLTLREHIERNLRGEVKTYDQYLTGSVYGYTVEHNKTGKEESCWGFYQEESPGASDSYVLSEARAAADSLEEDAQAEDKERIHWEARDTVTSD